MISSEVGGELALPRAASSQRLRDPCQLLSTHGSPDEPCPCQGSVSHLLGWLGQGAKESSSIPLQPFKGWHLHPCIPWDPRLPAQDMAMGH